MMDIFSEPLLCEHCGLDLTGIGLIANINHMNSHNEIAVYKVATDNEMREAFMELGMPKMMYDSFHYAQPTEMEKQIFEDNSRFKTTLNQ